MSHCYIFSPKNLVVLELLLALADLLERVLLENLLDEDGAGHRTHQLHGRLDRARHETGRGTVVDETDTDLIFFILNKKV